MHFWLLFLSSGYVSTFTGVPRKSFSSLSEECSSVIASFEFLNPSEKVVSAIRVA